MAFVDPVWEVDAVAFVDPVWEVDAVAFVEAVWEVAAVVIGETVFEVHAVVAVETVGRVLSVDVTGPGTGTPGTKPFTTTQLSASIVVDGFKAKAALTESCTFTNFGGGGRIPVLKNSLLSSVFPPQKHL